MNYNEYLLVLYLHVYVLLAPCFNMNTLNSLVICQWKKSIMSHCTIFMVHYYSNCNDKGLWNNPLSLQVLETKVSLCFFHPKHGEMRKKNSQKLRCQEYLITAQLCGCLVLWSLDNN